VSQKAVIAVGGNSLIRAGERGTIDEQLANAYATASSIAQLVSRGWEVVVTHGNGPQAGAALLRSERAASEVYTHPLDVCVATTQGEIGYILQRALQYELLKLGLEKEVLTIPTMVAVDPDDPGFKNPTKPIGPFYSKAEADKKKALGWQIVEDSARGYRRVVPSPEPKEILELDLIKRVLDMGIICIALGGGGVPVIKNGNGKITGSEAVIDKDRSSALLAKGIDADIFIISTDTDKVYLNYKKPDQKALDNVGIDELEAYYKEGQFPPGSMGPKIESVIRFIREGGKKALITSYEYLMDAIEGKQGTHIHA
jgi:carbamate kinase